jgi:small subunit ribosomal protein S20
MANSRSARKNIRSSERKHVRNRAVRSAVRTKVGKARRALLDAPRGVETEQELRIAVSALDRAAEKGVLHPRNAARRKSRLTSMAARLAQAAQGAEGEQAAARSLAVGGTKGRSAKAAAARKPAKAAAKPAAKTAPKASVRTTATKPVKAKKTSGA